MNVRVLIVDDFALMRDGIAAALAASPEIEVVGLAADGQEALELARSREPDVVVLDLRMAEHGGMEALDRFAERLPAVKTVILTANANPENVRAAISAGASGYLTKEVGGRELCEAVLAVHRGRTVLAPAPVERAAAGDRREDPSAGLPDLTARERRVVRLLGAGKTDKEIASALFIGLRTVQYDLASARRKAGVSSRSELARWAVIHSLT